MELKQTDLGRVPKEWNVTTLQELCRETISYGIVQCGPHVREGIPYIRVSDMDSEVLDVDQMLRTAPEIAAKFKRSKVETNDLIYALRGRLGDVRKIPPELNGANLTQGTARIAPKANISSKFLIWAMRDPRILRQAELEAKGTTFKEITLADLRKLKVLLPTEKEQEAIADALSDADAYIESIKKIIAKKRLIKKGVMKELLENAIQDAEVVALNSLCWFQEGPGVRTHQFTDSGVKLLNGTNIKKGHLELDSTVRFISKSEAYGSYRHFLADDGDIVIASSGISVEKFHEKVAIVKSTDLPLCMNTSTIRFKPKSGLLDRDFLYQYLISDDFKSQIGGQATGSAQLNFGPFHLNRISVKKPSLEYQKKVAQILNDFDLDLFSLDHKLQKARLIKQGMMQELLTGRIRFV